ncbi:MAG: hypothetical protein L0G22_07790 [Propionibacteriaceae bacterium]|nr:hypothetical protein [Propionibacteriaceae bacterium]
MSSSVGNPKGTSAVRSDFLQQEDIVTSPGVRRLLAVARIVIGFFFLWPFLDKLFGLGYSTPVGQGWLAGTAPAQGFIGRIDIRSAASCSHCSATRLATSCSCSGSWASASR